MRWPPNWGRVAEAAIRTILYCMTAGLAATVLSDTPPISTKTAIVFGCAGPAYLAQLMTVAGNRLKGSGRKRKVVGEEEDGLGRITAGPTGSEIGGKSPLRTVIDILRW